MIKKVFKPYVLPTFYVLLVVIFALFAILLSKSLQVAEDNYDSNLTYVSYEVLVDYVIPVINETNDKMIKPYKDSDVTIGKSYYDYKGEEKNQEGSIIYYENTYIQNSGVDYVKKDIFDVVSVFEGQVLSVTNDDIVGKTIKIKHNDNVVSIYQSLSEVKVKANDTVKQGQVIGKSGTNSMNSALGNHLHFELVVSNNYVNPESYYNKTVGEF